jgi:hypothetical protein
LKVVFGVTSGADEVSEHEECSSVFASDLVGTRMIEKDLRGSTAKLGYNVGDRALTAVTVQGYEALEIMEKTKGPNGDTSAAKRLCGAPRSADSGVGPRNHLLISGRGEELPP